MSAQSFRGPFGQDPIYGVRYQSIPFIISFFYIICYIFSRYIFMYFHLLYFFRDASQFSMMLSEDGSGKGAALVAAVSNSTRGFSSITLKKVHDGLAPETEEGTAEVVVAAGDG